MPKQPPPTFDNLLAGPEVAPAAQDKAVDAFEAEKKRLELLKLELEIEHIREPWYKKPAYLGVMIPSFLAFATLMIGIATGYFRNQSEIIQLRAEKAGLEAARFEEEKKALAAEKGKLSGEITALEGRKAELDQESLKNQLVYNAERQKLSEELQKLVNDRAMTVAEAAEKRNLLEEKGRMLEADFQAKKVATEKELAKLEGVITRLRDDDFFRPVNEKLELLASGSYDGSDALGEIQEIVRSDEGKKDKYITLMALRVEDESAPLTDRAALLSILFSLTGEDKWKNRLFGVTRKHLKKAGPEVWEVYANSRSWEEQPDKLRAEYLDFLLELARSQEADQAIREGILLPITSITPPSVNPGNPTTAGTYFDIVELCMSATTLERNDAFTILQNMAPEAYVVLLARSIGDSKSRDALVPQERALKDRRHFSEEFVKALNIPELDEPEHWITSTNRQAWEQWRNEHKELMELWTEPGLKRLRRNPSLVRQYQ